MIEKDILADAIKTAIEYSKEIKWLKRIIAMQSILIIILIIVVITK